MSAPPVHRLLFAAVYGAAIVALTVPVAPAVWSGAPSFFGLPRSMVWVVAILLVVFVALVLYDRVERRRGDEATRARPASKTGTAAARR